MSGHQKSIIRSHAVLHTPVSVLSCHQSTREGSRGIQGWDPTSPCPVQCARTPLVCCHCRHPSTPSSWPWESFSHCSVTTRSRVTRKGERTKRHKELLRHPSRARRVWALSQSNTHKHTPYTGTYSSPGQSMPMTPYLSMQTGRI